MERQILFIFFTLALSACAKSNDEPTKAEERQAVIEKALDGCSYIGTESAHDFMSYPPTDAQKYSCPSDISGMTCLAYLAGDQFEFLCQKRGSTVAPSHPIECYPKYVSGDPWTRRFLGETTFEAAWPFQCDNDLSLNCFYAVSNSSPYKEDLYCEPKAL